MQAVNSAINIYMKIPFAFFLFLIPFTAFPQVYLATGGECSFHSSTPVEDIDAVSESLNSVLNLANNEIQFKVALTTFRFEKALMREHFNEKYVESDKYPHAFYKGVINEKIDVSRDTVIDITSEGTFSVHGVEKAYKEKGKLTIKNGGITIEADFKVALKDHNIAIPKIVMANISEVIDVHFTCSYQPYKKKQSK